MNLLNMTELNPINFKELSEEFKERTNYSVEIIVGNDSITLSELESDISDVLNECNIPHSDFNLPPEIKLQFCLYNKLWVRWSKPETSIMAWFHFPHLLEMIESKIEVDGKALYLFDDFTDMWKVYIQLPTENGEAKLYFANLYENTYLPMRISVANYYKKLALCMGLSDWQEFFMEDHTYESNEGIKKQFHEYFELTFPNTPFSEFLN